MELRTLAYSTSSPPDVDVWNQPMFLIPMWNIVKKIEAFKQYFAVFDVIYPSHMYRQPIDLSTVFPEHMIHVKEEEFVFKGEIIKIQYKYV